MGLVRRKVLARLAPMDRRAAKKKYRQCLGDTTGAAILSLMTLYVGIALYTSFVVRHDEQAALSLRQDAAAAATRHGRALAANKTEANSNNGRTVIGPPNFPNYAVDPYKDGGSVVYILGMIYTFMGLAVVCDEFFVPALEVMIDKFGISDDVAGATLMAAGGSAPELTTSLIGTFLSESDVGFGTIVGSAVFNVIFVIGMCAVFSKEILTLTWWPLARDSSYYIMSLGLLALFFGGPTEESAFQIEFWEALLLFLAYVGYVIVMMFNVQLKGKVERCCGKKPRTSAAAAADDIELVVQESIELNVPASPSSKTSDAKKSSPKSSPKGKRGSGRSSVVNHKGELLPDNPLIRPTKFRAGVLQMVLQDQDKTEQLRIKVVAQVSREEAH